MLEYTSVEITVYELTELDLYNNEAWQANLHKDKRIMNWQPFMNNIYAVYNKIAKVLDVMKCKQMHITCKIHK